ncbi:5-(carboxyamino)imidazole ribonucleotide mutase [candidate division WOR-3 bacterium JGI_Cruoil_03_44_89]|uniref:Phosphoribosylaminoimidazole carboxylase n=1 Tax=candidate division WOR-3 bacterium JGI_Cruoil_03_44_89 TaxID=1973748 RepID=A0A235BNB7_UNCW3|nr:MAG: 5-(carboxyamino)imidazole ribonucleotide mutase [candidate division WOR-3 bacterium JGI_Cruoil_03_44_89]
MSKAVIIMGSKADLVHSEKIATVLKEFGVECALRVASAHKTPLKVLEIIREYETETVVFITVAGRSNALSGFVDANTTKPVIAAPPHNNELAVVDIFSSLRMPSGVCPMVVLEPAEAALAAIKILAIEDEKLTTKIREYQRKKREVIAKNDSEVKQYG